MELCDQVWVMFFEHLEACQECAKKFDKLINSVVSKAMGALGETVKVQEESNGAGRSGESTRQIPKGLGTGIVHQTRSTDKSQLTKRDPETDEESQTSGAGSD